jgi:hypothetical protein
MLRSSLSKIVAVFALVLALSACASAPSHINNVCRVFDQKNGWFENWRTAAEKSERKYGVPVPVLMATLRKESGFQHNAKPPRTMLLGFIPWKRASSAYGYSQALDGTWTQYQKETGNGSAKRNNFADAVDFVGWYHSKTADRFGVSRTDAYNLYLAYYFGWSGYGRGDWAQKTGLQRYARETEKMAREYEQQLQECN